MQFKSVFTKDTDCSNRNMKLDGPHFPDIDTLIFNVVGIEKLLRDINPSKSSGPDKIPGKTLKELASELAPFFKHFCS